ncbi:hypothetical protein SUDANB58_05212 [Streptomyces sp. enrichment culture]
MAAHLGITAESPRARVREDGARAAAARGGRIRGVVLPVGGGARGGFRGSSQHVIAAV